MAKYQLVISFLTGPALLLLLLAPDNILSSQHQPQIDISKFWTTLSSPSLSVTVYQDGSYALSVGGNTWLRSAPAFVYSNGLRLQTGAGLFQQKIVQNDGEDRLGQWESVDYVFSSSQGLPVQLSFRVYQGIDAIIFEQSFPEGISNSSVGHKDLLSTGFPGFAVDGTLADLGYLSYGYIMVGDEGKHMGRWTADNFTILDGRNGGPMALFDKFGKDTLFISPMDQFMPTSVLHDKVRNSYHWGVMGSVKHIPKGFSFKTIIYHGAGINNAIAGWGKVMRTYYNKQPHYRQSDFTNNYLSYWTDNGAYYVNYYVKGGLIQNMTYEEAMLGVKDYADKINIPYRSVQYSVWFKPGKFDGNGLWEANPTLFIDGMKYMFNNMKLPATAHSRYWSPDTPYAKQNGGKYDFFVEKFYSLPYEEQFWTDMFSSSQQFGFKTYMQDWLNKQFDDMDATTDNVYVARNWLRQMGEGARRNGITIQYCMSESRHILQSLEIPVVTQARASDDYHPNAAQWRIGISSMFSEAVGLAPYKDTFWTTTYQPHNYYNGTEPFPKIHVVISTLSTGPVGPGDMIGGTNRSLLMKCCGSDGLILKPSRPATAIDSQIIQNAFGGNLGPEGELWTTHSDIGKWRFGIIFATDMKNIFKLGPTLAGFGPNFPESRVYTTEPASNPVLFDDRNLLTITEACSKANPCLFYTSPVFKFRFTKELILLGEVSKYVPISPQRVLGLQWDEHDFQIKLRGAVGEVVNFYYVLSGKMTKVRCLVSDSETVVISVAQNQCLGA